VPSILTATERDEQPSPLNRECSEVLRPAAQADLAAQGPKGLHYITVSRWNGPAGDDQMDGTGARL